MKIYTIKDKEEAKKFIGRKVKVVTNGGDGCVGCETVGYLHHGFRGSFSIEDKDNNTLCAGVESFQLIEKTLDDVEVGDVLVATTNNKIDGEVLARINDIVAVVHTGFSEMTWHTIAYLKQSGYTLKDSSPEKVEEERDLAHLICDVFFDCGARIGKAEYDKVNALLRIKKD